MILKKTVTMLLMLVMLAVSVSPVFAASDSILVKDLNVTPSGILSDQGIYRVEIELNQLKEYGMTNEGLVTLQIQNEEIALPYDETRESFLVRQLAGFSEEDILNATVKLENGKVDECFIATAAFGTKFATPVSLLRSFRDDFLLTNMAGQTFVDFYYKNSPSIASFIADNAVLKTAVRASLLPAVGVVYFLYHPWLLVSIMVTGFVTIVLMRRKFAFKRAI
ncbi:hypothetical protein EJF36_02850 [Bacillus sp. HMF5848]|uniref:CFI-box-CTERM domain-containing protein n=1 Tax=Bacillus sp. HMF5848 TaxID=2495421 RepID=UPI000F7AAF4D|nr:CFI-box-CTERM domain-containing protein [Bacillus sp. HMF5848]RSK25916.1 hypothetical protein EJF36_02850 [Bacillus sp. HMF5848]